MEESKLMHAHQIAMFAEHYQFYVCDSSADPGELSVFWPQEARDRMLLVHDTILGIATVRNIEVPVQLDLLSGKPGKEHLDDYDQVIECKLSLPSAAVCISAATEDFSETRKIDLDAGEYGVRVYWGGLDEVDAEGFEGEDYYRIALWKTDKPPELKILKQWQNRKGSQPRA